MSEIDTETRRARTAAATRGRMRASEERQAAKLSERGWLPVPPELAETVTRLIDQAGVELPAPKTASPR